MKRVLSPENWGCFHGMGRQQNKNPRALAAGDFKPKPYHKRAERPRIVQTYKKSESYPIMEIGPHIVLKHALPETSLRIFFHPFVPSPYEKRPYAECNCKQRKRVFKIKRPIKCAG